MNQVEHVLAVKNTLGEAPIWHPQEQVLYWVDIDCHCFFKFDPATGKHQRFEVGLPIGAIAFRADGGLIMATQKGIAFWNDTTSSAQFIVDPEDHKPQTRFNDAAVDCQGRFWAGTLGDRYNNALYRFDPDGSVHLMETGIGMANGIGWSPDNQTLYFTDTLRYTIYAYDYDATTGTIANRRIFVHDESAGLPDGLTVDSDGFIWSAWWGGWRVTRYAPEGKLERQVKMPVECPTSCTFGGANLDELYMTSACATLGEVDKHQQPLAGDLFRLKTTVTGLSTPKFAG
ncbi:MAG TPA: SMP-30/gluconolactonase/LRE family protein [Thiotrichaceae bacterium]|nr:SMP-30/gluconolactonase/LRE family protein [Thiotrichaceae bacterium]